MSHSGTHSTTPNKPPHSTAPVTTHPHAATPVTPDPHHTAPDPHHTAPDPHHTEPDPHHTAPDPHHTVPVTPNPQHPLAPVDPHPHPHDPAPVVPTPPASTGVAVNLHGSKIIYTSGHGSEPELSNELKILKAFLADWNAGTVKDINGYIPPADRRPAVALNTTANLHPSTNSPAERVHITVLIITQAGFPTTTVKGSDAGCVHIYAHNDNVAHGYESFYVQRKGKNNFSPAMSAKLIAALGNTVAAPVGV